MHRFMVSWQWELSGSCWPRPSFFFISAASVPIQGQEGKQGLEPGAYVPRWIESLF